LLSQIIIKEKGTMENLKISSSESLSDSYSVEGTVGYVGTSRAPVMRFLLNVNPSQSTVSGKVHISQANKGKANDIIIDNVKGIIRPSNFKSLTQLIMLEAKYLVKFPGTSFKSISENFSASLAVDNDWVGCGEFMFEAQEVGNVPVSRIN
jgi:hypothetical protein